MNKKHQKYRKLKGRERIPDHLRIKIFERDCYKCSKCKTTKSLEIHHIIPLYYGGTNHETNLITLCSLCHYFAPNAPIDILKCMANPNKPPINLALITAERAFVSALMLNKGDYEVAKADPVGFWKARYGTELQSALEWFYSNA